MTKYYGRAKEVAESFVKAFEDGSVAPAIAKAFIMTHSGDDSRPIDSWSITNKVSCLLQHCYDPRGFKQWQEVGRTVKKGERSKASILIPLFSKEEAETDNDESERKKLYGYKGLAVFDVSQTEGEEITEITSDKFFAKMPLVEVAIKWNIGLDIAPGRAGDPKGSFSSDQRIMMRTWSQQTFLHELIHAAHDKLGTLKNYSYAEGEVVAELGAVTLAHMIGMTEINPGYSKKYLDGWTENKTAATAMKMLGEIGKCIDLILEAAEAKGKDT